MLSDRFKNKYRIPSIRLQNWNYSWDGYYFVTICVKDRQMSFGHIETHGINSQMVLLRVGRIAEKYWLEIPKHFDNIELDEHIIMPNHLHGLIKIGKAELPPMEAKHFILDDSIAQTQHCDTPDNKNEPVVETQHCCVSTDAKPQTQHCDTPDNKNEPVVETQHCCVSTDAKPQTQHCCVSTNAGGSETFYKLKPKSLSVVIRSYKSIVLRESHKEGFRDFFWQPRFYDRIIRNQMELFNVRNYIISNPGRWNMDIENPGNRKDRFKGADFGKHY